MHMRQGPVLEITQIDADCACQHGPTAATDMVHVLDAVCLLVAGLISSLGTKATRGFILYSAGFLTVGGLFLMFYLPILAPRHRSTSWVFTGLLTDAKQSLQLPNDT